ncbi:hypothetical protein D3C75_1300980 [compost metagenome]
MVICLGGVGDQHKVLMGLAAELGFKAFQSGDRVVVQLGRAKIPVCHVYASVSYRILRFQYNQRQSKGFAGTAAVRTFDANI